ncbi:Diguanylate cyclase/phosphodiesterase with PAS/PAC sensor(S) (fragment) [Candidatus Terasakiella magnetica]|uniref:Diguanylate cyclase/phosphodiesterase with PAS/PAC sensor(S) n=1 Tax=Candidatus Terasakiella magnetica TaxID=1867952 RepID=A0A1C3RKZ8_9PROT
MTDNSNPTPPANIVSAMKGRGCPSVGVDLKNIVLKLSSLESEIQTIHELASFGSHISDCDDVILQINSKELSWLGVSREEVIGKKRLTDFLTPESQLKYQKHFPSFIEHRYVVDLELDILSRDGTIKTVSMNMTENVDSNSTPYQYRAILFDISDQKLWADKQTLQAISFESLSGTVVTNSKGIIEQINKAFTDLTGYDEKDAIGQPMSLLSSGRHDKEFYKKLWSSLLTKGRWQGEIWNRRKDGRVFPERLSIAAVYNSEGEPLHYIGTFFDLTASKKVQNEVAQMVYVDQLTKLPNRRMLEEKVAHALALAKREKHCGAILFVDLDNFKIHNDTRGHDFGDLLLIEASKRLKEGLREKDSVARIGGDEFVVLLEMLDKNSVTAAIQAKKVSGKILESLARPYQLKGFKVRCTASIGLCMYEGTETTAELLQRADIAMYESKNSGRNTFHFFDPEMQLAIANRAALESELHRAINREQFELYYQAQVNSKGQTVGAEALIRWHHPERGLTSPLEFIPLAEETGLILPIGKWVLEKACAQIELWQKKASTKDLVLSVNVSAHQFHQVEFLSHLKMCLQEYDINPNLLQLELTESISLNHLDEVISKLSILKEMGVECSIDDFGTGFSSLSYLAQLPFTKLKIDKSFVDNIGNRSADNSLVEVIVGIASHMRMEVIAEGVEEEIQERFLLDQNCHMLQGYLFGRPVPIKEFDAMLAPNK